MRCLHARTFVEEDVDRGAAGNGALLTVRRSGNRQEINANASRLISNSLSLLQLHIRRHVTDRLLVLFVCVSSSSSFIMKKERTKLRQVFIHVYICREHRQSYGGRYCRGTDTSRWLRLQIVSIRNINWSSLNEHLEKQNEVSRDVQRQQQISRRTGSTAERVPGSGRELFVGDALRLELLIKASTPPSSSKSKSIAPTATSTHAQIDN